MPEMEKHCKLKRWGEELQPSCFYRGTSAGCSARERGLDAEA